jgi:hypothetical protein
MSHIYPKSHVLNAEWETTILDKCETDIMELKYSQRSISPMPLAVNLQGYKIKSLIRLWVKSNKFQVVKLNKNLRKLKFDDKL